MPLKHEKFVAKVREESAGYFPEGESVEEAVPGQSRSIQKDEGGALVDFYWRLTGKQGSRLIVLTDRNLYLAANGAFAPWKIKEVKVSYPRSEAGAHLRAKSRLSVAVDEERIVVEWPLEKHLTALVKAAGGTEWTTADEVRAVRASHPEWALVGVVLGILAFFLFHLPGDLVLTIASSVVLLYLALDHVRKQHRIDRYVLVAVVAAVVGAGGFAVLKLTEGNSSGGGSSSGVTTTRHINHINQRIADGFAKTNGGRYLAPICKELHAVGRAGAKQALLKDTSAQVKIIGLGGSPPKVVGLLLDKC